MMKKNFYKVDFSIDNLSLKQQDELFKTILCKLDFNQRQNLHIVVTDLSGGKHYIWDGYGVDPLGIKCNKCNLVECCDCPVYNRRKEKNDGKNNNNTGNN